MKSQKKLLFAFGELSNLSYTRGKDRNFDNKMDCGDFVKLVFKTLGDTRTFPRFSSTKEEAEYFKIKTFLDADIGDIIFLNRRNRNKKSLERKPYFSHVGIKFSNNEIMHLNQKNRFPKIEKILDLTIDYEIY